jgi:hypothetical protein
MTAGDISVSRGHMRLFDGWNSQIGSYSMVNPSAGRLALVLVLAVIGTQPAAAISRIASMSHSCNQLRQIIANQDAVIITHPGSRSSGTRYDRYVSDTGYCDTSSMATSDWVPAKDGSCRLTIARPTSRYSINR